MDIAMLAGGLVLLVIGGDLLVRGAVAIAMRLGMSSLLIGLTLVGFGTSTPELVTSVQAALSGSPGIAVGNFVGSNIANILLILGLSALITPIAVASSALKRDGIVVLLVAIGFTALGFYYPLNEAVGIGFLAALSGYIVFAYLQEKTDATHGHTAAYDKAEAYEPMLGISGAIMRGLRALAESLGPALPIAVALTGLALVVLGGKLLVDGAISLARQFGISETVIGLTIVAVGTSLPELVTSVIAALRKHSDVALGNIMGSNIYNILGIGGVTAIMAPTAIPAEIVRYDNLIMVAASVALLAFAFSGRRINRLEGLLLLVGYGVYVFSLWPK